MLLLVMTAASVTWQPPRDLQTARRTPHSPTALVIDKSTQAVKRVVSELESIIMANPSFAPASHMYFDAIGSSWLARLELPKQKKAVSVLHPPQKDETLKSHRKGAVRELRQKLSCEPTVKELLLSFQDRRAVAPSYRPFMQACAESVLLLADKHTPRLPAEASVLSEQVQEQLLEQHAGKRHKRQVRATLTSDRCKVIPPRTPRHAATHATTRHAVPRSHLHPQLPCRPTATPMSSCAAMQRQDWPLPRDAALVVQHTCSTACSHDELAPGISKDSERSRYKRLNQKAPFNDKVPLPFRRAVTASSAAPQALHYGNWSLINRDMALPGSAEIDWQKGVARAPAAWSLQIAASHILLKEKAGGSVCSPVTLDPSLCFELHDVRPDLRVGEILERVRKWVRQLAANAVVLDLDKRVKPERICLAIMDEVLPDKDDQADVVPGCGSCKQARLPWAPSPPQSPPPALPSPSLNAGPPSLPVTPSTTAQLRSSKLTVAQADLFNLQHRIVIAMLDDVHGAPCDDDDAPDSYGQQRCILHEATCQHGLPHSAHMCAWWQASQRAAATQPVSACPRTSRDGEQPSSHRQP